jgi:hypothetical protein
VPRSRGSKRGTGSSSGRLGKKTPAIAAAWGPVRSFTEPAAARGVVLASTRYSGQCASCGVEIPAGSRALWRPGLNRLECEDCSA